METGPKNFMFKVKRLEKSTFGLSSSLAVDGHSVLHFQSISSLALNNRIAL